MQHAIEQSKYYSNCILRRTAERRDMQMRELHQQEKSNLDSVYNPRLWQVAQGAKTVFFLAAQTFNFSA